ncbi:MAG: M20/M25/M40 family metallo-hydrolase [Caldilineaceae bacterium]|nr:M20/M25/M40 family metallo-hydrolase [Caldilineaceae bacterium]
MNEQEQALDAYIDAHRTEIIEELVRFCAQPSVSARGEGIAAMVTLASDALRARGLAVDVYETGGYPVIVGRSPAPQPHTLLLYNHYDVQPEDPMDAWLSPPFEPTLRDGRLYARGVMDDKGHIVCRLAAIDAVRAVYGDLPCEIKFVIEGEEEIGSPNLPAFVEKHRDILRADGCLWEFGDVDYDGASMNYLGFRGLLYVQFSVQTANLDAHSGIGGTIFPNAAWRLTWALTSLKDSSERVLIPGFYDDVVPPTPADLDALAQLPAVTERHRAAYGLRGMLNDMADGIDFQRAAIFSPSCTICGLTAGYQGPGAKTIMPAQATAKMDFRLVPNQDPADIFRKLRRHLDDAGFADVAVTVLGSEKPARTPVDDPFVQMVVEAARDVYGQPQRVVPMSGGSGPAHAFVEALEVPVVTAGVGYPGSQIHAPNENIRVDDLIKGVRHTARIIARFGAQSPQ